MKRPLRDRVWFYKPTMYWYGFKSLRPFWFGDDEYHWRTLVLGWNPTGQIVIALSPFKGCDKAGCWEDLPAMKDYPGYPVSVHEWN